MPSSSGQRGRGLPGPVVRSLRERNAPLAEREGYSGGGPRRSVVVLARSQVEAPAGELRLKAQRERDRLRLWVGDRMRLEFRDVFPLAEEADGRFALQAGPGTRLARLRARQAVRPVSPSGLERGNELFDRQEWQEALKVFEAHPGPEAQFKAALCSIQLGISVAIYLPRERPIDPQYLERSYLLGR